MRKINLGLIGFGTIGSGVVKTLRDRKSLLKKLTGVDIELKHICDKDLTSDRGVKVPRAILTKDPNKILKDPEINIVIELMGGIHPAKEIILSALRNKKAVVTANKALLAECGREIFAVAKRFKMDVRFEASVGGGIPIIKALREGFVSNKIDEIHGIINGTCNYILSRMSDEECEFKVALKAAQKMGVAEANPVLDISGADSVHKLVILAGLSFGGFAKLKDVYCEGILLIEPRDIKYAKEMGYCIKLLAITKRSTNGIELRVHPTLIPLTHPLANVKGVYNAIYVKGDLIGENLFYGEGAGKLPTASAVISDIVDLGGKALNSKSEIRNKSQIQNSRLRIKKIGDIKSKYYIRFSALDRPGVLAKISGILGKNNISIASVAQKEERVANAVPIVMMTHEALEYKLQRALRLIDRLAVIKKKSVAIRMESL
jgi:homoserine dehydrogenase